MSIIGQPEFRDQATIRPLFYDALSGEFLPPSDPEHRRHTLGRLIIATISKGRYDDWRQSIGDENAPLAVKRNPIFHHYEPSWAPVKSTAITTVERRRADDDPDSYKMITSSRTITGIQLQALDSEATLAVYDNTDPSGGRFGVSLVLAGAEVTTIPVSLGNDLNTARVAVADAAQAFFDQVL